MMIRVLLVVAIIALAMDIARAEDLVEQYTTKEGAIVELVFREGEGFVLSTPYIPYIQYQQGTERQKMLLARKRAHGILKLEAMRMVATHYGESRVQGMVSNPAGDSMEMPLKSLRVYDDPLSMEAICGYTKLCTIDTP